MGHHHKHKRHKRGKGLLSLLITAFILKIIWNALIPELFHGPFISYLQAILIILIGRLISGGHNWRGGWGHYDWNKKEWKEKWENCGKEEWKNHFEAKWREMEDHHHEDEAHAEAERQAQDEANREKEEYKEGFKKDGKFDVNVVDVEEKEEEEPEDDSEEKPSNGDA